MNTGFSNIAVGYDNIDRDSKVKFILQKINWLENIIQEFIDVDKYYVTYTYTVVKNYLRLVKLLKEKLQDNRLITKSDMHQCNRMLKDMKRIYSFNIDWRGDIVDCKMYTKYKSITY